MKKYVIKKISGKWTVLWVREYSNCVVTESKKFPNWNAALAAVLLEIELGKSQKGWSAT